MVIASRQRVKLKKIELFSTMKRPSTNDISDVKKVKKHNESDEELWQPPSFNSLDPFFKTTKYSTEIPPAINLEDELILGIDEAGRGPIMGPMVYSVAYCKPEYEARLKNLGFNDSKVLKHDVRLDFFKQMQTPQHELNDNVGWLTTIMTAKDISSGMLRVHGKGAYNLNDQAHDTTIDLIKMLQQQKVNIKKIFVDTVGPPEKYQAKLKGIFPNIEIRVAKKADSLYAIVSCASIVAKVTRDLYLHHFNRTEKLLCGQSIGSGYPSDPNTSKWLNQSVDKVFGWHYGLIRYSWQTAKDSLIKNKAVEVTYEEAEEGKRKKFRGFGSQGVL